MADQDCELALVPRANGDALSFRAETPRRSRNSLKASLLVAFALAPALVLLVAGIARRWIDDDGFINLRVVRNILDGHGPVYNLDERVEAGTSPLWLFLLVLLGGLRARLEDAAVYSGLLFTLGGLLLGQLGAYRLIRPRRDEDGRFLPRFLLPVGAATFAVLPPAWDYATSGLETGLGVFWLGATFCALVWLSASLEHQRGRPSVGQSITEQPAAPSRSNAAWFAIAMLVGLAPLVRPEFLLYGFAMAAPLAYGFDRHWRTKHGARSESAAPRHGWGRRVSGWLMLAAAAGAIPIAYELFRAGYYAALVPNTVIAKEAARPNWEQGLCYARNFFGLYWLALPLFGLAGFVFLLGRSLARDRRWMALLILIGLVVAALVHASAVVAMGGDYMHGRMFLPAVFALGLPVSLVGLGEKGEGRASSIARLSLAALTFAWMPVCGFFLRVATENECGIGDERGWYARQAGTDNPTRVEDYRGFAFYSQAERMLGAARLDCPSVFAVANRALDHRCRPQVYLSEEEEHELYPSRSTYPVTPSLGNVAAVTSFGAIGIMGYVLPSRAHLVDRHGLADPIGARLALEKRGRPGHEKVLAASWLVARFGAPLVPEDASVAAARRALRCEPLASLERATRAPLTWRLFFENIAQAARFHTLRIPADPFEADQRFCGAPEIRPIVAGGEGGSPFAWRCPQGMVVAGLKGAYYNEKASVAAIQPLCRAPFRAGMQTPHFGLIAGPTWGEARDATFYLECPDEGSVVGIRGKVGAFIGEIGLLCAKAPNDPLLGHRAGPPQPTNRVGVDAGQEFEVICPNGSFAMGMAGRSGALIDAVGVFCTP